MKPTIGLIPMVGWLAFCDRSVKPLGGRHGVGVIFDGEPIDNIIMPADRRAHRLMVRSGLAG